MSESGDRTTSRRAFATGAGVFAAALGGVAKAAPASPWGGTPAFVPVDGARQHDLITLGNSLYNSPTERAKFVQDPQTYVSGKGLKSLTSSDLANLKGAFADGFCCNGCGCS